MDNFAHDIRIKEFWQKQREKVDSMSNAEYRQLTKTQILPLARIKKIMKIEDEVKNQMISGEGPILIAKASEFLIEELTLRAWLHAESNRRKTLQKTDIANATVQNDMFDFLIDIVPRSGQKESNGPVPIRPRPTPGTSSSTKTSEPNETSSTNTEEQPSTSTFSIDQNQIQYFVQCPTEMLQNGDDAESNSNGYNSAPHIVYCDPAALNGVGGSLVTLDDGRILEAMPIGQPIPLSGPNQPIQVMTVANGAQMQFVQANNE